MSETIEAQQFINKLNKSIFKSDDEFKNILIEGMHLLNLNDEECAHLFYVSRPTITRWRNGTTTPIRVGRRFVSDVFKRQVRKYIKTHQRNNKLLSRKPCERLNTRQKTGVQSSRATLVKV